MVMNAVGVLGISSLVLATCFSSPDSTPLYRVEMPLTSAARAERRPYEQSWLADTPRCVVSVAGHASGWQRVGELMMPADLAQHHAGAVRSADDWTNVWRDEQRTVVIYSEFLESEFLGSNTRTHAHCATQLDRHLALLSYRAWPDSIQVALHYFAGGGTDDLVLQAGSRDTADAPTLWGILLSNHIVSQ